MFKYPALKVEGLLQVRNAYALESRKILKPQILKVKELLHIKLLKHKNLVKSLVLKKKEHSQVMSTGLLEDRNLLKLLNQQALDWIGLLG